MRHFGILYLVLAIVAIVLPIVGVYPVFMMKVICFAMFACAFNLMLGFGGLLSFGHAAFFGSAAYVGGWLAVTHGVDTVTSIVAGTLVASALGVVFGLVAIRRHGIYFAMVTLALSQLVYFLCLEAPFTRGENGLQEIPRGTLFGVVDLRSDLVLYYFVLACFCCVFLLIRRVVRSPFGQVLTAIRENENRATSLGYDVARYKLLAFVLSAGLAGFAGAIKAVVLGFVTLSDVAQSNSGEVILMTLLGGMGTFFGPVVGATVVVSLQEYLSDLVGGWVTVIIGAVFVLCVLSFRKGIVGELEALRRRL